MKALVVKSEFGGFERGHTITDPLKIEEILAGENAQHVSPTELDEPDSTAPVAADSSKKKSK